MNRLAVLEKPKKSPPKSPRLRVVPAPVVPREDGEDHPFVKELIREFRQQDPSGNYRQYSTESLLHSWVISGKRSNVKNPEIDRLISLRVAAYYQAIAKTIERQTGQLTRVFLNLNHQGVSSALICCGNLLVVNELLPKIQSFGFDSIDRLVIEAEKLIDSAVTRIHQFY
ncbi:DUF269 domain-containing protein [Pannus brasiliensis CCIBt3594]|uniref:DUF269 domain-containing protein n=1 Tax=Pannus brasiliensis CCIBt3594 TaxID=1427578 RepID=A0AAW9QGY7_9CHRO